MKIIITTDDGKVIACRGPPHLDGTRSLQAISICTFGCCFILYPRVPSSSTLEASQMTSQTPTAPFVAIDSEVFPFTLPQRQRLLVPPSPLLSNPFTPTTADLVAQAEYMMTIARNCDVTADPDQPNNPYATIGAMRALTEYMHRWLAARLAEEERNLLLMDRLRYEEQQDRAHEHLMATDAEYAADFEDEVPHE